ncbi:hypothetical protein F5888DRAFT_952652 [Russula emetica]|nr:hypothetical protein F5888DRAFT_952652 [Russula emetica]
MASSSSADFQSIFNASLQAYDNKTKNKLLDHPLATQLQSCDSPNAVLTVLQDLVRQFDQRRTSDERLNSWLDPTVNVLSTLSDTLGEGVSLAFPPGKVIFAGIGVLLLAAKDVNASQDMLVDLFERIGRFFKRVESYTERTSSGGMTDMMMEVTVEVLSVLAIVTVEIKQSRRKKYFKKLLGRNDVEDALKRLDKLTQEEAKMATAEVLNNVKVLVDDDKEARAIMQQEKRSSFFTLATPFFRGLVVVTGKEDLHSWLSPLDPSTNHEIACNAHHDGTATWFFHGGIYEEWKSTPSLLWMHGKPGSGKSVLCSGIIEGIKALQKTGSTCLAFFYCDFRDEAKQNHRNLIISILWQLAAQSDLRLDLLSRLYSKHDNGRQRPSEGTLSQCLKEMLSLPTQGSIYLIIDAVDECPNNSGMPTPREKVLGLVQNLVGLHLPNVHICVTSRPEIDIQTALEPLTSLQCLPPQSKRTNQGHCGLYQFRRLFRYNDAKMARGGQENCY